MSSARLSSAASPALRLCALAIVLAASVLALFAGTARAIDDFGPLGQIDGQDGSLGQLGGIAVSPDGSAIYAVDVGQPKQTDDCGNSYTPIVVHRYVLSADHTSIVSSSSVTLPGDLADTGAEDSVPVAVATGTGGEQLLLLGFDADHDANGDGVCTPVTDPALLTELDAATLAPVRTLTRSELGGFDVERLAVSPGTDGAPDTVWTIGVPSPATPGPSLTRWSGVPGDTSTAPAASNPLYSGSGTASQPALLAAGTGFCFVPPTTASSLAIAGEPDGSLLMQVGSQWAQCADLGGASSVIYHVSAGGVIQQQAVRSWSQASTDPLPISSLNASLAVEPLAVDPASGDMFVGEYANGGPGIQELDSSGNEIRAWGPQPADVISGFGTAPECTFPAGSASLAGTGPSAPGVYIAAASGLVVTGNVEAHSATQPPDTTGPLITWFGAGALVPRCLLTSRPTATLTVTPASGAGIGVTATLDASASAPNTARPIDSDNTLTYQFESDASGYGPPTTNPVFKLPLTHSGTYPLGVLVTDSYGQQAEARIDYVVSAPPPVAVLTASDLDPTVGETVTLDGSHSQGTIQNYQFDLDGSGNFATENLSNPTVSFKFAQAGPVDVGLRVTNDQGAQATTTLRIDVQGAPPPPPVPVPADGDLAAVPGAGLRFSGGGGATKPLAALRPARIPARTGAVKVSIDCLAGGASCGGKLWLSDTRGRRISSRASFKAESGATTTARPLLRAAARKLLKRKRTLTARVVARMNAPDGASVTDRITRVLRRPAAWAPKRKPDHRAAKKRETKP